MKMTTQSPKSVHRPLARTLLFVSFMAVCLALFQTAQAVNPPPDGGYSGDNTAEEQNALLSLTTGKANTAVGNRALYSNTSGSQNTAIGQSAGANQTTGSGNVYIGNGLLGVAGESNACYIKSIFTQTSASGIPVLINASQKLGTTTSSKRFKEDIKPMDKASEALFALNPGVLPLQKGDRPSRYIAVGPGGGRCGKVNPDLVVRDTEGKPYTVRYDQVNAMLLNEFLKEHRTLQEQGTLLARLEEQVDALTAGLQKVKVQVEAR